MKITLENHKSKTVKEKSIGLRVCIYLKPDESGLFINGLHKQKFTPESTVSEIINNPKAVLTALLKAVR